MKITCPNCASQYTVADDMLGPEGRKVKCANCSKVWRAMPDPVDTASPMEAEEVTGFDMSESVTAPPSDAFDSVSDQAGDDLAQVQAPPPDDGADDFSDWGEVMPGADPDHVQDGQGALGGVLKRRKPGKVRLKGSREGPSIVALWLKRVLRWSAPAVVAVGLVGLVLAVPYRDSVVRQVPDLAKLYSLVGLDVNVRGITFAPVTAERSVVAGLPVLQIDSAMTNMDVRERNTAPLRLALLGSDGAELFVWQLEPPVSEMAPGQTVPLSSELTAPPETVAGVSVRFLQDGESVPTQVF